MWWTSSGGNKSSSFGRKFFLPGLLFGLVFLPPLQPLQAEEGRFDLLEPEIKMDAVFKKQPGSRPKRVAILPFLNETDNPEAANLVRRAIYNHFSSLSYGDLELADTDARLRRASLLEEKILRTPPWSQLAEVLKTDAVMRGKVTSFSRMFAVIASTVEVGAELELVRLQDGKVLWRGKQTARSINGGLPTSPLDLVVSVFYSATNMREQIVYRVVDQLSRELVATIPDVPIQNVTTPPQIKSAFHNSANLPRKVGDVLEVAMEGEAGYLASFDIGGFKKGFPLDEVAAGIYRGRYQVMVGDRAEKETLVFHLKNDAGQQSNWSDFQGLVTLDTTPPKIPANLMARGMDGRVALRWEAGKEGDLAGYGLYRSEKPLSGFQEVSRLEENSHSDGGLKNNTTYYYKVMALDRAGNGSDFSPTVSVIPVTAGPTMVKEDLTGDGVWRRGASPYMVETSIIIPRGVRLEVESGVEIIFSPGVGMTVKGGLALEGTSQEPVLLRGKSSGKPTWQGILLDQSQKENRLRHVQMGDSQLGLVINASKVSLDFLRMTGNGSGLTITEGSQTTLKNSLISHNQGTGVALTGSNTHLLSNTISHNGSFGLVVRYGVPEIRGNFFENNQYFDLVAVNEGGSPVNLSDNGWGSCDPFSVWERIAAWHINRSCVTPAGGKVNGMTATLPQRQGGKAGQSVAIAYEKYQGKDYPGAYLALLNAGEVESSPLANYLFGRLLAPAGNMREALAAFQKAVALDSEQPGYGYWLGIHYLRMGQLANARREWEKIVAQGSHEPSQRMLRLFH